jgi:tetratricopeptide (TPR) repeat protein
MIKLKKHKYFYNIMLTITLVFFIVGFLLITKPVEKLYDKYYSPYSITVDQRSSNKKNDSIQIAFEYMNNKKYDNAIIVLQKIISDNDNNMLAHFYLGVLYQEIGDYKNAIKEYDIVCNNNDNIFVEQAKWYTALCYLKFDKEKAQDRFKHISETNGYYQSMANEILFTFKINHNMITLFFLIIILCLIYYVYRRQVKYEKISNQLIDFLTRNVEFLNEVNRQKEITEIKNIIQLYSRCQVISKVANCDYISFFKYDYSNRYITLNFILSINHDGSMVYDSLLYEMGNNILNVNYLNFNDNDLYFLNLADVKDNSVSYVMNQRELSKFYYRNIYKNSNTPIGFIAMSFKDNDYIIPESDKNEIIRMIENLKKFL